MYWDYIEYLKEVYLTLVVLSLLEDKSSGQRIALVFEEDETAVELS